MHLRNTGTKSITNEYEGFSKQDLKDRRAALLAEFHDHINAESELLDEVQNINKLLQEKK